MTVQLFKGRGLQPFNRVRVGHMHIMPGSWNPLHDAHRWMFDHIEDEAVSSHAYEGGVAYSSTTSAKYFELSTSRIGKEDLKEEELSRRLSQFAGYADVIVTPYPYFSDKYEALRPFANLIVFHIGYDNYERLREISGEATISQMKCRFCVWPRNGKRLEKGPKNCFDSGVDLPAPLQGMSSTQIRSGTKQ